MSEDKKFNVVFVSGNVDLSEKSFMSYYMNELTYLAKESDCYFLLSDDDGCALLTQMLLSKVLENKERVSIYHIGNTPKNYVDDKFMVFSGFNTLEERDAALTFSSNKDYHVILPGKGRSACENNIIRRNEPEYNYMKHYLRGNSDFWSMFFKLNSEVDSTVEEISLNDEQNA